MLATKFHTHTEQPAIIIIIIIIINSSIVLEFTEVLNSTLIIRVIYRGADKSLARPGREQTTTTEDTDVHILYLLSLLEEF